MPVFELSALVFYYDCLLPLTEVFYYALIRESVADVVCAVCPDHQYVVAVYHVGLSGMGICYRVLRTVAAPISNPQNDLKRFKGWVQGQAAMSEAYYVTHYLT